MTRKARALVLSTALAAALSGCSGGSYSTPDALCGVPVGSAALAPLLPDGQKLEQSVTRFGPKAYTCTVSVDGKDVVYVADSLTGVRDDPVASMHYTLVGLGNLQKATVGDDARVADRGGIAVSACTHEGSRQKFAALVMLLKHPVPKATADRRKALEDFLRAYLPKAMAAENCRR
ncbi:hypothetical protein ACFVYD_00440 [Streptomyces sp. NPDC058301]|uniref:hypothetical protein n=1 Tax=Streptomyces sp. NPDC058301 TaxID=3346436 RepID=UPI0036F0FB1C